MAQLSLRKLSREAARHFRQIAFIREPITFTGFDTPWSLRLMPMSSPRSKMSDFDADWGGAHLRLRFDHEWLIQVSRKILGIDDLNYLPEPLRPLFTEAAFAEVTQLLEQGTRKRFSLNQSKASVPLNELTGYICEVEADGYSTQAEIWLDALGLGFLASALRETAPDPASLETWGNLTFPVFFLAGWADISLESLQALKRRDVLILDESWLGPDLQNICISVAERFAAGGLISGHCITVLESLGEIMDDLDELSASEEVAYGDLPIRMSFSLGEKIISLSELMVLGPGHVFDMGRELRRAVLIRANGKVIGEGELVEIEGQVGVSVLSLSPPSVLPVPLSE